MKKKYDDSIDYINGYPISEVWGTYGSADFPGACFVDSK